MKSTIFDGLCAEWREKLGEVLTTNQFLDLSNRVEAEYKANIICPPQNRIFHALNLVKPDKVRVVILGQDPYFNPGQATGLAFSIPPNFSNFPPTLKNIIKEIKNEFGTCSVENGDLEPWARQGVLLLNTCLTVRQGACFSHKDIGWNLFIDAVIKRLNDIGGIIFVLWGANAKRFEWLITNSSNHILKSAHPSPLSAHYGFFGCNHFMKINEILGKSGDEDIKW